MKRLLLFDIDGTLIWGGPAKEAFHLAMVETFGSAGDIERFSFAFVAFGIRRSNV